MLELKVCTNVRIHLKHEDTRSISSQNMRLTLTYFIFKYVIWVCRVATIKVENKIFFCNIIKDDT